MSSYESLREQLTKEFFLVRKTKAYWALGGFVAFLLANGLVSYTAALSVVQSSGGAAAERKTKELKDKAQGDADEINRLVSSAPLIIKQVTVIDGALKFNGDLIAKTITAEEKLENRGPRAFLGGYNDIGEHYIVGPINKATKPVETNTFLVLNPSFIAVGNSKAPRDLWVSGKLK